MAQFNLNMTPEFEKVLEQLMRIRGFRTKSEAVRTAVQEALERERRKVQSVDYQSWVGLACRVPENPHPRFQSDNDLWKNDRHVHQPRPDSD